MMETFCIEKTVPAPSRPRVLRTVSEVLQDLALHPGRYLFARWNWKAALLSSILRAAIFFFTNLVAGWHAAVGALSAELALRLATSGFWGAITEALSEAQPAWAALAAAVVLLPLLAHSLEFLVHWLRHTPKLAFSVLTSIAFTCVSTAFNMFAMRRGALTVGHASSSLSEDLSRIPGLILDFVLVGPRMVISFFRAKPNK